MKYHWELVSPIQHGYESEFLLEVEPTPRWSVRWRWLNQHEYKNWEPKYQQPFYDALGKGYLRAPKTGDISVHLILQAHTIDREYEPFTIDLPHENCRRCAFRGFLKATRIAI